MRLNIESLVRRVRLDDGVLECWTQVKAKTGNQRIGLFVLTA
jgi:hypothetical protein